jgi:hypothetical protein
MGKVRADFITICFSRPAIAGPLKSNPSIALVLNNRSSLIDLDLRASISLPFSTPF